MFKYFSPALFLNFSSNYEWRVKTANNAETLTIKRARDHKLDIYDKVE